MGIQQRSYKQQAVARHRTGRSNYRKTTNGQVRANEYHDHRPLFQRLFTKEYVTVDRVPELYRVRYIRTGYRQAYSSFLDCLVSAIRLNNETFNIWTQVIPFIACLVYFYCTFPSKLWPFSAIQPQFYPLLAEEVSFCVSLLGSSVAHAFNCMSPRILHTCFYIDYAMISVYAMGVTSATFYYLRPLKSGFFLFDSANLFTGLAAVCSVVVVYVTCSSRHNWENMKFVIRTLAFAASYLYANLPTFYRFYECGMTGEGCTTGLKYLFIGWNLIFLAAFLNASRMPEKYFPCTFDIYGHNHQWMHVVILMGNMSHLWAVFSDLEERKEEMDALLEGMTFNTTLGWTFGTMTVVCVMALWFGSRLTTTGELRSRSYLEGEGARKP